MLYNTYEKNIMKGRWATIKTDLEVTERIKKLVELAKQKGVLKPYTDAFKAFPAEKEASH